jgi:hypothetical protein
MKRCLLIFLAVLSLSVVNVLRAETDAEVNARKDAADVARAFANEGFMLRDGHWCGIVKPHEHSLVAVNLYAGNQYWFSAAGAEPTKKIGLSVYDETGKKVTTETYNEGAKAAAGFSPVDSGQYFVSVDLLEGDGGSFCLVYSYK